MSSRTPHSALRAPNAHRLVSAMLDWFVASARDLPWRRTHDPYAIWVSEIMLQQTQVKTVIPFWERWLRELPTIEAAANASSDKLHKLWEGLGYYTRVRNLQKAAQEIMTSHGGKFPERFEDVLALPGIGRYTAGAICSIAFNQPTPILDGNVMRVLTRVFGIAENPKEKETNAKLWSLAEKLVVEAGKLPSSRRSRRKEALTSKSAQSESLLTSTLRSPPSAVLLRRTGAATVIESCSALNQSLMELGALICTPRNAQCGICPLKKLCVAFRDGRVEELPNLGRREQATARRFVAFVIGRGGKFLVRQRPVGVVNAHLWEFPNVEVNGSRVRAGNIFKTEFGSTAVRISPLTTVKHSITRYRITLEAFQVEPSESDFATTDAVWKTPAQMHALAFTSAHGKVLRALNKGIQA